MSIREGGDYICYKDGFQTGELDEWNKHCSTIDPDTGTTHITEEGTTQCITCGIGIEFKNLPFHPINNIGSKNIQLKCEDCEEKTVGKVQRVTKEVIPE